MKLFGRKAGREESRPALSRGATGFVSGTGWPASYEAQLREGYCRNAVAQRAVRLVAEGVGAAPLVASDPALVALVTGRSGGQVLVEVAAAQLLLHGNAYIQVLRDAEGGVAELYALRPERVSVELDAGGWPAAYRYKVGERVVRLIADPVRPEIVHLRCFNPVDDHYGLGCMGAAAGAVAIHNAASAWNKALLDNAARSSGALVYDPGDGSTLSPDQFARLRAEMDASFSGGANAGRPMLLEGGLKWQALGLSPADMDFAGTRAAAAREIALAFGVPPMLLGMPGDATYANYREANRALWRLAILPLAGTILNGLAQGLGGWFAGATLAVDLDRVPALAEDRVSLWAAVAELAVQTSSYGTQIAKLFGTMRVAGTVIWATDLIETRSTSGGKGRAATTSYAYAASFAVLLSARAIRDVRRIWADGKLLRGAAGDFKVRTGFRVHLGGEDQAVDPLIASAEGGAAPAHRGCAYVVFEGLELAEFGNRIPSLTFEVVADEGAVASGTVVRALAGEVEAADDGLMLGGFAASGGSVRAVLDTLAQASGGWFAPLGDALAFRTGGGGVRGVADAGFGAAPRTRRIAAARTVPGVVSVAHYDAARDYQAGLQRARAAGGVREARIEVPAAIDATTAKAVALATLARGAAERVRRTVAPGLDAIAIAPGAIVAIDGEDGVWRVARAVLEGMAVTLELVRVVAAPVAGTASGGRVLAQTDAVAGATLLAAFEIPALDDVLLTAPRLTIAAAGTGAGWRSAALLTSADDGATWDEAGSSAAPAILGRVEQPPGVAATELADLAGTMVVRLAHDAMLLDPADDAALDRGANLALVGDELIQFGAVAALGDARWRLSRLLRGRRGTEWAVGTQVADDRFVLIEAGAVRTIALPAGTVRAWVIASGVGDAAPAAAQAIVAGDSVRPPTVAGLRWEPSGGGATVRWIRRSRLGWRWIDGADAPLGEESESYVVRIADADGSVRVEMRDQPWVAVARGASVTVRQRGTHGESRGATLAVPV